MRALKASPIAEICIKVQNTGKNTFLVPVTYSCSEAVLAPIYAMWICSKPTCWRVGEFLFQLMRESIEVPFRSPIVPIADVIVTKDQEGYLLEILSPLVEALFLRLKSVSATRRMRWRIFMDPFCRNPPKNSPSWMKTTISAGWYYLLLFAYTLWQNNNRLNGIKFSFLYLLFFEWQLFRPNLFCPIETILFKFLLLGSFWCAERNLWRMNMSNYLWIFLNIRLDAATAVST